MPTTASVIATLRKILERGHAEGVFRHNVDPIDLHLAISSYCFFRVANRHTFGLIFKRDMTSSKALAVRRRRRPNSARN